MSFLRNGICNGIFTHHVPYPLVPQGFQDRLIIEWE